MVVGTLVILRQRSYETQTYLEALEGVLSWFASFHDLPISREVGMQCQLGLIEGFTNVVRHAHKNLPPETPINIEITVMDDRLSIKIWDHGPGFDFQSMLERKLQTTTSDSTGGRGLVIMYRVADTLEYIQVADQRNCLHIQKYFEDVG